MFPGRRFDIETGLYYYRARYYYPYIGRFLQTDPIDYKDSMNLYIYVRNNPVVLVDPMGLVPLAEVPWFPPEYPVTLPKLAKRPHNIFPLRDWAWNVALLNLHPIISYQVSALEAGPDAYRTVIGMDQRNKMVDNLGLLGDGYSYYPAFPGRLPEPQPTVSTPRATPSMPIPRTASSTPTLRSAPTKK